MSDHRMPSRASRSRKIGRATAIVAGAVALSGIAAGTASAAEGYGGSDSSSSESTGLTPTSPVDGFVYHWMTYHYGEKNFVGDEVQRITSDPSRYAGIHLDMVKMMLGGAPDGGMGGHY